MKSVTGKLAKDHVEKLNVFRRAVVSSVTAWQHGLSMGFNDSPLVIDIEGEAEIRSGGHAETFSVRDRIAMAKRLLDLLGSRLSGAKVAPDGVLTLSFEAGTEVILRRDASGYENYVIVLPDETTLVG